jgi:isochorismate synthase
MHAEALRAADARREAHARAARLGRPVLLSLSRPLHAAEAMLAIDRARSVAQARWHRPSQRADLFAEGAAYVIEASGPDRFASVASAWGDLLADAVCADSVDLGAEAWTGPVLLGGFAFDPVRHSTALWAGWGAARFVLPARLLATRGQTTWLTTNELIGPARPAPIPRPTPPAEALPPLSPAAWQSLVGDVAAGLRSGALGLDKVVLARAHHVRLAQPFDPHAALQRLSAAYPTCTSFAFAHHDAWFVGATPEQLVEVHAGVASTMALAASTPRGANPAEDDALAASLLRDAKQRSEHDIVLRGLRQALRPVSTGVIADAEPRIERLPNLQHLLTRIRAQLAPGCTILDVVERLHPSPAVGGSPREPALALIRASEGLDRGWYAGAIGWLDRFGDGEFVVGIRSALVRGSDATLFAGCGIVADSDPAAEYAESCWKLRPMLAALGAGADD